MKLSPDTPPAGTIRDWLDSRAEKDGTAVIFPETDRALRWADLRIKARAFAAKLTNLGVKKGESIAIMAPNGVKSITALYGAIYGGFRATMINLAAGRHAIGFALEHCEARFAFVHDACHRLFEAANPGRIESISLVGEGDANLYPVKASDPALLMYTSGTTGQPKGVVHNHSSLLAGGWTTAIAHQLSDKDRGFCILPIYHINGLCVTVMASLVSGGSLAMISRFSATQFWAQAQIGKITWFSAVPTIISHLLHGKQAPSGDCQARIRFGRSASSALAVETQMTFEERFSIPIIETMGLTETAAQILSNPLPPGRRKIGSPGISYGCEVQIHDKDGLEVKTGTEGEIVVRGPNILQEYLKNPAATKSVFRDTWFKTGDLARKDEDGYVFVTGRLKELIIKGGENIAPREIDEVLYTHPDVVEAAAFGRPCDIYGERIEAAVRIRAGANISDIDLLNLCNKQLGKFKSPDRIYFMDALPKGPSGKIQRLKLAGLL